MGRPSLSQTNTSFSTLPVEDLHSILHNIIPSHDTQSFRGSSHLVRHLAAASLSGLAVTSLHHACRRLHDAARSLTRKPLHLATQDINYRPSAAATQTHTQKQSCKPYAPPYTSSVTNGRRYLTLPPSALRGRSHPKSSSSPATTWSTSSRRGLGRLPPLLQRPSLISRPRNSIS